MAYVSLPQISQDKLDGNLTIVPVNNNPIVMVIGTASQGTSESVYRVDRISDAAAAFGKSGNLTRGLYETSLGGALNLRLFRIGATAAKLENVGGGLTLETFTKDDSAGTDYTLTFTTSDGRLRIWDLDSVLVYDNNPSYPLEAVDLNEVTVTGTVSGGSDITSKTFATASSDDAGVTYTAGTDGLSLSRMETYEALEQAYDLLSDQVMDVVVPMNVFLDDNNIMDLNAATVGTLGLDALGGQENYPSASDTDDYLLKAYKEEVDGEIKFWWWGIDSPNDSAGATAPDATNVIWPNVTGATATATPGGASLTEADFHEVNFAHQLALFCHKQASDNFDCTGTIGVLPPASYSLKEISKWVGKLPTYTTDATSGDLVIASASANGSGLLGNKFMGGRAADAATSGTPGLSVNGVDGLAYGGFIATDDDWLDGTQLTDANEALIDLGKYISVVSAYPTLSNPSQTAAYAATGAPTYGGFYSTLSPASAPTNKLLAGVRLPFRLSRAKVDALATQRYVHFHTKAQGVVVADAPTAARPASDYRRLSTVRQVKAAVDSVRVAGEPFLGESMSGAQIAALDTAIDRALSNEVRAGTLTAYRHAVTVTDQQRILGQATVDVVLQPAFELRHIQVQVALSASI